MTDRPVCPCCGEALDTTTPRISGPDRLHGVPGTFDVAVCGSCGAGVTLPRLEPAELAQFYPDSYGPYDHLAGGPAARVSRLIQRLQVGRALRTQPLRALRGLEPGRLLDVGCGRGDLAAGLIERGWRVSGIEPSANACAAARSRGVDARQGTIESVELDPGYYDAAIFRHSLEHVGDPVDALRRAGVALRPGGLVLISVPNFACWQRRRMGGRWYHLDLPRHRVHFTPAALTASLARAGFAVAELGTSTTPVGLPATIQYALAGRCLFRSGLPLRVAVALTALCWPLARMSDGLGGGGDVLDAAAVSRSP
jgi:SAM-dependent methyltransferase